MRFFVLGQEKKNTNGIFEISGNTLMMRYDMMIGSLRYCVAPINKILKDFLKIISLFLQSKRKKQT